MDEKVLHNSTIERLTNQHRIIPTFIEGLSNEALHQRINANKWSIHENLAHLGRYQDFFEKRLILILKEKSPKFDRYKAEEDPMHDKWIQLNLSDILLAIDRQRDSLKNFVVALTGKKMKRTGIHPKLGQMDIPMWTEFFLLHEAHHLYAVFQISQEMKKRANG